MQACPIVARESRNDVGDLVRQAQRREVAAFEALYRQHVGRVYALCRRLCGDPARAEELTQETFVRAWRHRGASRPEGEYGGWICKMAIHVTLGESRARRRRERREVLVDDPAGTDTPTAGTSPGTILDLERAIDRLPDGARKVFVLHDVEGFRHEEIGRLLGLNPGTSKAQLHRARRLLREVLET